MPTAIIDRLSSPRILAGTKADIWVELAIDGGLTRDAAAGVTVGVVDADGNVVIAAGTAVDEVTGTGLLRLTMTPAQTATVNRLVATWSNIDLLGDSLPFAVTSYHEIVGDQLFTLSQARAWANEALKSEVKYPNRLILEVRDQVAEAFEQVLGFPLGLRAFRDELDGDSGSVISLSQGRVNRIRAASTRSSTTWTAFTASELANLYVAPFGRVVREAYGSWGAGYQNYRVAYEAGMQPIAQELRRAGLILLQHWLISSDLGDRTLSHTDQTGNYTVATPGLRGAYFGLPVVDEALNRYRSHVPAIA